MLRMSEREGARYKAKGRRCLMHFLWKQNFPLGFNSGAIKRLFATRKSYSFFCAYMNGFLTISLYKLHQKGN